MIVECLIKKIEFSYKFEIKKMTDINQPYQNYQKKK